VNPRENAGSLIAKIQGVGLACNLGLDHANGWAESTSVARCFIATSVADDNYTDAPGTGAIDPRLQGPRNDRTLVMRQDDNRKHGSGCATLRMPAATFIAVEVFFASRSKASMCCFISLICCLLEAPKTMDWIFLCRQT